MLCPSHQPHLYLPANLKTRPCSSHNITTTHRALLTFTQPRRPQPQLLHRDIRLRKLPLDTATGEDIHINMAVHVRRRHNTPATPPRVVVALALLQDAEAQADLGDGDDDGDDDEHNDDPGDGGHLRIGDSVGQDLGEVEEDAAALVEDLDAWVDLEVVADGGVERREGGLGLPEEVGRGEDVGSCEGVVSMHFCIVAGNNLGSE